MDVTRFTPEYIAELKSKLPKCPTNCNCADVAHCPYRDIMMYRDDGFCFLDMLNNMRGWIQDDMASVELIKQDAEYEIEMINARVKKYEKVYELLEKMANDKENNR